MAERLTAEEYRAHTREVGRVRQARYRANNPNPTSPKERKLSAKMKDKEINELK